MIPVTAPRELPTGIVRYVLYRIGKVAENDLASTTMRAFHLLMETEKGKEKYIRLSSVLKWRGWFSYCHKCCLWT